MQLERHTMYTRKEAQQPGHSVWGLNTTSIRILLLPVTCSGALSRSLSHCDLGTYQEELLQEIEDWAAIKKECRAPVRGKWQVTGGKGTSYLIRI